MESLFCTDMDFDISEKVKEWASESGQELDRIIKKELSKFGIDEEYGLSRVYVDANTAVNFCSGVVKLSDWYIDGCLVFSIFRKVDIENPGVNLIKTGENSFKIVPNGKASTFSSRVTVQYSIQEHEPDEFSSFIMSRFERRE